MRDFGDCQIVPPRLRKVLRAGRGHPLDRETRRFMEARFGRDFGGVRVQTGAAEAEAAEALRTRAFTMGDRIVFQEGQYNPHTTAGRRLLAHELAHVVQQQGRDSGDPARWRVGAADDLLEHEAELVADRVMSGGALPPITPDPGGIIRRVVRPDISTAAMPNLVLGPSVQTPRAPSPIAGHGNDADFTCGTHDAAGNITTACITRDAQVRVNGGATDTLAGWTFGIIQVQWIETNWGHYKGQAKTDGSIFLQRARRRGGPTRPVATRAGTIRRISSGTTRRTSRSARFLPTRRPSRRPSPSLAGTTPPVISTRWWRRTRRRVCRTSCSRCSWSFIS